MTTEDRDLEARVTLLEEEVARVRHDAAAARVLAGGADRDVTAFNAKLTAHNQTLNALRETQLDQGRQIKEMRAELTGMRTEFGEFQTEVRSGFSTLQVGMAQITALLNGIAGRGQDAG